MNILAPSPGESVAEVVIGQWLKKNGDRIGKNEKIAEIESEKATLEITSETEGVLEIRHQAGETVKVGAVIAVISGSGSADTKNPASAASVGETNTVKSTGGKRVSLNAPSPGESIQEVVLAKWHKQSGVQVNKNDTVASIESEKATLDVTAPVSGVLTQTAQEGQTVKVNTEVGYITEGAGNTDASSASPASATLVSGNISGVGIPSPAAAKILAEKNINPNTVSGTGKDGRITKADAITAESASPAKTSAVPSPVNEPSSVAGASVKTGAAGNRVQDRQKMSQLRKKISERLVSVKNTTAMLTTFNEIDMSAVMDVRSRYKDIFKEKHSIGLGFMSFFVKAASTALAEFPAVNGMIDGDDVVMHNYVDMGIAVSTPKGLMVPVIRNAETLSLAQIEKQISEMAVKARDNKITVADMTGGTFTITNGGVFGSMLSTPIINPPQSAILGMHNIVKRPAAVNDEVVIRPVMYVALSYDHRIIDGRESVSFLLKVKQLIEDPVRLLLNV